MASELALAIFSYGLCFHLTASFLKELLIKPEFTSHNFCKYLMVSCSNNALTYRLLTWQINLCCNPLITPIWSTCFYSSSNNLPKGCVSQRTIILTTPEAEFIIDGDAAENVKKHYGHKV